MKKYLMLLGMAILFIAMTMSGCSNKRAKNTEDGQMTGNNSHQLSDDMQLITSDDIMLEMLYAPTKDGCYTSDYNYNYGGIQLFFIDYESKKMVPLSNNLSGTYGAEGDTSWFEDAACQVGMFTWDEHLYVFENMVKEDQNAYVTLYRMDLDGKNRKQLCQWEPQYAVGVGLAIRSNDLYVYISEQTPDGEVLHLSSVNLQSGEWKKIRSINTDGKGGQRIVGAFDKYLVILQNEMPDMIWEEDMDVDEIIKNEKYCIELLDVDTMQSTQIKTWKLHELTFCMDDSEMYYVDYSHKAIMKMDCRTGTEEVFMSGLDILQDGYITGDLYLVDHHWMFFKGDQRYALDMDSKKVQQITIKSEGDVINNYMKILGISNDSYLVCSGDIPKKVSYNNENGVGEEEIYVLEYSLIKKDDFWNSRSVYDKIVKVE
ncbi:MAG: hypothetical protein MRZ59_08620 [Clostridiales bacterium]|nr:hypothetical protein [Clostridiales bacterium]MDY3745368.1 hypothetical protein [Lachnospiraceae bacterium]